MDDLQWLDRLSEQGYVLWDDFLGDALARQVRADVVEIFASGLGRPAMVGRGEQPVQLSEIRRDEICWLEDTSPWPAVSQFMAAIEALRQGLNEHAYLGLKQIECHAACYRPGGFYKPHMDVFAGTQDRVITFVYFLNPDWQAAHAGQLQMIRPVELAVEPIMDRLVLFKSRELLHQVLPTQAERYTLTGWMRTD